MAQLNDTQIALLAARTLIADPECWTKIAYARATDGRPLLSPGFSNAVCWCSIGALKFAVDGCNDDIYFSARRALALGMGADPMDYNDHPRRTHPEVLAAFDRAIELAA